MLNRRHEWTRKGPQPNPNERTKNCAEPQANNDNNSRGNATTTVNSSAGSDVAATLPTYVNVSAAAAEANVATDIVADAAAAWASYAHWACTSSRIESWIDRRYYERNFLPHSTREAWAVSRESCRVASVELEPCQRRQPETTTIATASISIVNERKRRSHAYTERERQREGDRVSCAVFIYHYCRLGLSQESAVDSENETMYTTPQTQPRPQQPRPGLKLQRLLPDALLALMLITSLAHGKLYTKLEWQHYDSWVDSREYRAILR